MNEFSIEESNLISIFAGESRTEVIKDTSRVGSSRHGKDYPLPFCFGKNSGKNLCKMFTAV